MHITSAFPHMPEKLIPCALYLDPVYETSLNNEKRKFHSMHLLDLYSDSIKRLCAKHNVKELYAFGSVLGSNFNEDSDIDLLVNFERMDLKSYANNYFNFKSSIEDLFQRSVDLVEESAIKNPYFKSAITNSRQLVYGSLNKGIVI